MRIKTFSASTMANALDLVRQELGSDAVIVSSLEEDGCARVTAALEDELLPVCDEPQNVRPPILDEVCDVLEAHNVSDSMAEVILEHCVPHAQNEACFVYGLDHVLSFAALPVPQPCSAPTVLVGPPGVGKTVTIAKLAMKASLEGHPVHVITTDTQKAGAIEQLTSYAKALTLTLDTASSSEELYKAIENAPKHTALLIDTPGINPFHKEEVRFLAEVILALRVAPLLVLPAGGDVVDQKEMMEAFQSLGASRVLLTRVDLARRWGGVLGALYQTKLKLVGYSNSPMLASPIHEMNAENLAGLLQGYHQDEARALDFNWTTGKEESYG